MNTPSRAWNWEWLLIIERPILELLDITKETSPEVTTEREALIIYPVRLSKKERLRASTKRMMAISKSHRPTRVL